MNRFSLISCLSAKDENAPKDLDYDGDVIVLSAKNDSPFVLFFPISEENAKIIRFLLKSNQNDYNVNTNILGIYKTMIESWRRGDRFLSGIIMDRIYDHKLKDEVITLKLVLSDDNGEIDSLVHVNFVNAMFLSIMEEIDILVTDELLIELIPDSEEFLSGWEKCDKQSSFPEDKGLLKIVKEILKNNDNNDNCNNDDNDSIKKKKFKKNQDAQNDITNQRSANTTNTTTTNIINLNKNK